MMKSLTRAAGLLSIGLGLLLISSPATAAQSIKGTVKAKKAKHVKSTVVYLERVDGDHAPPAKPVVMDQQNQVFLPFVLPIVVGTTVDFLNNDNTIHNVFSPDGEKYDLGNWAKGETRKYTFKKQGVYTQLCKLHPAMLAYVVVLQNPYFTVVDAKGAFEIKNVPPGDYKIAVWNKRKRKTKPVAVHVGDKPVDGVEIKLR